MGDNNVNLPPGFRFCPTDEELVVHFLHRKAALLPFHPDVIPDLDLYPFDPWELQGNAMAEGNKWYYFSRRTRTRITGSGYWKALGDDESIMGKTGKIVGVKKFYMFYIGESPAGVQTNWIMHEYRLSDSGSSSRTSKRRGNSKTDYRKWVICQVYERRLDDGGDDDDNGIELSYLDEVYLSIDDLEEISMPN